MARDILPAWLPCPPSPGSGQAPPQVPHNRTRRVFPLLPQNSMLSLISDHSRRISMKVFYAVLHPFGVRALGRPYQNELESLSNTYAVALAFDVDPLVRSV